MRILQRACGREVSCRRRPLTWASEDACGVRDGGVSFVHGEDDGVVARIGGREGPEKSTIVVALEAVRSRLKEQAFRRGDVRSRLNMSQLVRGDGAMTPESGVVARNRDPCR